MIQVIMIKIKKIISPESHISQPISNILHNLTPFLPTPHTQNLQLQTSIISQSSNITQQRPISPKLGQQIEAVCWESDSFDPAEDDNKTVCWEHVSFDPAKDVERAGCGDQGTTDLAINQDERAGCGDQGSTNVQQMKMKEQDVGIKDPPIQTNTCITYHSGTEEEVPDAQIKALLEEHQHPANIPIGGRLTHFVDAWKLIGADALVTRCIKALEINTQAPQILERNMTNPVKIRSKDSQLALGKLIEKKIQNNVIKEILFSRLKWINSCFAILKSEPGKRKKIMDCSLLNGFLCAAHFIMEDVSNISDLCYNLKAG
ncbi:MAG: hypothetical protein EZS28_011024 [Streblomastix strix]|uniref:Uncharacterized protein n=1 Tax=Streblomastix strix TaxID=222440 RepID=A0A5J4WFF0_9EUKA|nr:MAG: hypothetical protein EZS28_011024 [Streblomastix strix]